MKKLFLILCALVLCSSSYAGVNDLKKVIARKNAVVAGQIVFDSGAVDAGTAWGATASWDHTVAIQSNMILIVLAHSSDGGGEWEAGDCLAEKAASPTAMVFVRQEVVGNNNTGLYYMLNPDSGTNTITCGPNAAGELFGISATFYGVKQQAPEANEGSVGEGVKLIDDAITSITSDAWVVMGVSAAETIVTGSFLPDYGETKDVYGTYSGNTIGLFHEEIATGGANTFGVGDSTGTVTWKIILTAWEEN